MSIDRYDWGETGMEKHQKGDYVSIEDYTNEVDNLKDEVEKLKEAITNAKSALDV